METVMTLSVAFIAFCMFVLMLAAVAALLRIRRVATEMAKLVETTRMHLPPLIHDLTQISADVRSIVRNVERDVPKLTGAFDSIRDTAHEVHEFERMIRQRLERPVMDVSTLISGILRGFYTFWRTLLR